VVVTCAYADPVAERLRARLRLRVTPVRHPHPGAGAPFVVVELDGHEPADRSAATSTRLRSLAGDPRALRAFVRKVLAQP
jgi:hypothetical protein